MIYANLFARFCNIFFLEYNIRIVWPKADQMWYSTNERVACNMAGSANHHRHLVVD